MLIRPPSDFPGADFAVTDPRVHFVSVVPLSFLLGPFGDVLVRQSLLIDRGLRLSPCINQQKVCKIQLLAELATPQKER